METVTLKPVQHNGEENIGMYFSQRAELNKAVRKIKNARWTRTHRCWYVPLSKEKYNEIAFAFKGVARIEQTELEQYLFARKKKVVVDSSPPPKQTAPTQPTQPAIARPMKEIQK